MVFIRTAGSPLRQFMTIAHSHRLLERHDMSNLQLALSNFAKGSNVFSSVIIFAVIIIITLIVSGDAQQSFAAETQTVTGKATGTLTIDGKSITLKYAYVMAQPNTFDERKTDIAVLLTEEPLDADALTDIEELDDAVMRQHGWAFFKLDEDGKPIHEMIDHPAVGGRLIMSGFTQAEFLSKKVGKDRVEGSFKTRKTEDFMGHTYSIKVDFSAPVLQAKVSEPLPDVKTGRTLPRGGGQPGKVYRAYLKAVRDRDISALRTLVPDKTQNMSDSEMKESLEFVAGLLPKNPEIADGYAKEGRAVLYIEGTHEGEKQYGTVELVKKEKMWGIVKESWSNTPPKK